MLFLFASSEELDVDAMLGGADALWILTGNEALVAIDLAGVLAREAGATLILAVGRPLVSNVLL